VVVERGKMENGDLEGKWGGWRWYCVVVGVVGDDWNGDLW
jgi:hypothetical protein